MTNLSDEFMMLEDLTAYFHRPSILDIKIGKRVWDDFADPDKIEREKKKYPVQDVVGFRIIGMRVSRCVVRHRNEGESVCGENWNEGESVCGETSE